MAYFFFRYGKFRACKSSLFITSQIPSPKMSKILVSIKMPPNLFEPITPAEHIAPGTMSESSFRQSAKNINKTIFVQTLKSKIVFTR